MKLNDLAVGEKFKSLEETGGFIYQKTNRIDEFGSILCIDLPINHPFYESNDGHWHRKFEKVEKV